MRRLSMSAHRWHHHLTPHERIRDELGVIADRYAPVPEFVREPAPLPDRLPVAVDPTRKVA